MPPPRFGLMGIRHFAKSPRPDGRAKCSAWAKCLERAGRLRSGPTCVNLYYVSQKSIMHGSRLIVPGFTRRRRLVGQRVTQEGIEDECFAVSPALAWRHFVAIPAHDIGDGNFTTTFVRGSCSLPKRPHRTSAGKSA